MRSDGCGRHIAKPPAAATRLIPIVVAGAILALMWIKPRSVRAFRRTRPLPRSRYSDAMTHRLLHSVSAPRPALSRDACRIAWTEAGDPLGQPVVVLHGGPGSGSRPAALRLFDLTRMRVGCRRRAATRGRARVECVRRRDPDRAAGTRRKTDPTRHRATDRQVPDPGALPATQLLARRAPAARAGATGRASRRAAACRARHARPRVPGRQRRPPCARGAGRHH